MKTNKKLWKSIASALMLLVLIVMVTVSCKKKDDEPTPPVPPVPPTPEVHDVFQNKPIHMMSDYEIANKLDFPGHLINQLGSGLQKDELQGVIGPFKFVGKTLWEIYDYKHTEMRFDQVMNGIHQIEGQLTQLSAQMTALGKQLKVSVTELEYYMTNEAVNTYTTDIQNVMDSTLSNSFGSYTKAARDFQNVHQPPNTADTLKFKTDTTGLHNFAYNVHSRSVAAYDVINFSTQLKTLLFNTGPTSTNGLANYANEIIQLTAPLNLKDSASMMICYMLLENYFLQIINYQFQCALVYSNACNYFDTTGSQANNYYTGTFQTDIKQEVSAFLNAVGYLAINLSDYRHYANMQADFPYAITGLAPDFLFPHALARSQFVSNLIYDALGLPFPQVSGTIITPLNYSTEQGTTPTNLGIDLNGTGYATNQAISQESQFPYTQWTLGDPATCSPDNHWNVWHFDAMSSVSFPTSPMDISVQENGKNYPWTHFQPIQGKVSALFYNPANPEQTSTSYSSTCSMQFGYFSARWNWGYCFITMTEPYSHYPTAYDVAQENPDNAYGCVYQSPPSMGVIAPHTNVTFQTTSAFFLPYSNMANWYFNGVVTKSEHYTFVADLLYVDIQTSSEKPPVSGALEMWGASALNYNLGGVASSLTRGYIGTGLVSNKYTCKEPYYISNANIIKTQINGNGASGVVCNSVSINTGTAFSPTAGYYFQTDNCGSMYLNLNYQAMMQVVYDGTYNIFSK